MSIIDIQGRMVQSVYSGELDAGASQYVIDTKSISPGIYLICVNLGDEKRVVKFAKVNP